MVYKVIDKGWVHEIKPSPSQCSPNSNKDFFFLHQVPNFLPSHYPTNLHKSKVKYIRIFDLGLSPIIHCCNLLFQNLKNMKEHTLTCSMPIWNKFQRWRFKLGPFLWPNPDFEGFTGQWAKKFNNLNAMNDENLKPKPKI